MHETDRSLLEEKNHTAGGEGVLTMQTLTVKCTRLARHPRQQEAAHAERLLYTTPGARDLHTTFHHFSRRDALVLLLLTPRDRETKAQ